jgi:hypothetical protein
LRLDTVRVKWSKSADATTTDAGTRLKCGAARAVPY